MITNYLKIAIKSLRRNPFFTSVNLFGIAFTLMLLVLVASLYESNLGNLKPLTYKSDMVVMNRGMLRDVNYDTAYTFKKTMVGGEEQVDTQMQISREFLGGWYENPGYFLLDKYFRAVPGTRERTFFEDRLQRDVFVNDQKMSFHVNHTDDAYWRVFDFEFTEGRPYSHQEFESGANVAVITTVAARSIFGRDKDVVGQTFQTNARNYEVVGVVEPASSFVSMVNQDLFFPYTQLSASVLTSRDYIGNFTAVHLASKNVDRRNVIAEINHITSKIPMPDDQSYYEELTLLAADFDAAIANGMAPVSDEDPELAWTILRIIIICIVLLFITVPTLNLINLNVSRIMERSSEIGVRKAFGATTSMIARQLLFENVVLTILGAIFGFLAALGMIALINNVASHLFTLRFNGTVFLYGVILTFVFGVISGLLPAYRTSKIHVVEALKNTQL